MVNQVEEVKNKTDIVSLIGEYIDLKKAGRNYKANCPFHGEKTPSFMVSPELQIYKCFGCGESGDAFTFLQKHEGMDFPEALKYLADKAGVKLDTYTPQKTTNREKIIEINRETLNFYKYVLYKHRDSVKIMDYLTKERGLKPETIKLFQLGYSPDKPAVLYNFLLGKRGFKENELNISGLFAGRNYDRFVGRVTFPLMDHRGNICGFSGRILPWGRKDSAKYINSPETPAYSKSRILYGLNIAKDYIREKGYVILVEGELDMISSFQTGIKNVVAIKGSALTDEQIRLLSRFTQKIIFCLDSDFAGDKAAKRGAVMAQNQGLEVKVARLKKYKDPDDAARKEPLYLKKIISESIGIWDFLLDSVFEKYDLSGEGKGKISKEITPVLQAISDEIVRFHYISEVAARLSVSVESVASNIGINKDKTTEKKEYENIDISAQKPRRQMLEEQLLGLLITYDLQSVEENKYLFSYPHLLKIISIYLEFKDKNMEPADLYAKIPSEIRSKFAEIFFSDLKKEDVPFVKKELEIIYYRNILEKIGYDISLAEKEKDVQKVGKLQQKFAENAKKLSLLEEEN